MKTDFGISTFQPAFYCGNDGYEENQRFPSSPCKSLRLLHISHNTYSNNKYIFFLELVNIYADLSRKFIRLLTVLLTFKYVKIIFLEIVEVR